MTESNKPKKKTPAKKAVAPKKKVAPKTATAKKVNPALTPAKRGRPPKKKIDALIENQLKEVVESVEDAALNIFDEKLDETFDFVEDFASDVIFSANEVKGGWLRKRFRSWFKRS